MAEKPMSNFKTAVNELMNGKIKTDEPGPSQVFSEMPTYETSEYREAPLSVNPAVHSTPSVFAPDLIIEGTVKSKSDIKLNGYIKGDVSSGGSIISTGTIDGNIDCINVVLSGSTINGNLNVKETVSLDNGSSVTGDIIAGSLSSDGKVKGNIILKEAISLKANASVHGNIKAKNISIETGTTLVGNLEIKIAQTPDIPQPAPAPVSIPAAVSSAAAASSASAVSSASSAPEPAEAPAAPAAPNPAVSSVADLIAKKEAMKDNFKKD